MTLPSEEHDTSTASRRDTATPRTRLTTDEWEQRLGAQFRAIRLSTGLDQRELAERAGVSVGSIKSLEQGNGSSLKTVIRVSRTLGQDTWLESLSPAISVSPIDLLRSGRAPRTRVYRSRGRSQ